MKLKQISKALDSYIRFQSNPVAIRMLSSADEIPKRAKMPKRDWQARIAVCQAIALARRSGMKICSALWVRLHWVLSLLKSNFLMVVFAFLFGLRIKMPER